MTRTWKWTALTFATAALIGTSAAPTSALGPRDITSCDRWECLRPPTTLHIALIAAYQCHGVLLTELNLEVLAGTEWAPMRDDGREAIQLFFVGNGLGSGRWLTVGSVSGGDGHLRFDLRRPVPTYDERVRLVRTDEPAVTSTPRLIVTGCPQA
jgi:hypothetical protein